MRFNIPESSPLMTHLSKRNKVLQIEHKKLRVAGICPNQWDLSKTVDNKFLWVFINNPVMKHLY